MAKLGEVEVKLEKSDSNECTVPSLSSREPEKIDGDTKNFSWNGERLPVNSFNISDIRKETPGFDWFRKPNVLSPSIGSKRRGRPSKSSGLGCPICNFETLQLPLFEEHIRLHNDKTVFNCTYCPAIFTQKGNLQAHIRTHTKERPFACPYCKFSASQRGNLISHLRTHTKEKPFKCQHCDYATAQSGNLQSHLLRRHGGSSLGFPTKGEPIKCPYCDFTCRRRSSYEKHVQTLHLHSMLSETPLTSHFLDISGKI